jgi:hypothetical protein
MNQDFTKQVYGLDEQDFINHPIWSWKDEDSDLVVPIEYIGFLPEDHNALFVRADLSFGEGTTTKGQIVVGVSDRRVFRLVLFDRNGNSYHLPLQIGLRSKQGVKKLAKFLKIDPSKLFPIIYSTAFEFADGELLLGTIHQWWDR